MKSKAGVPIEVWDFVGEEEIQTLVELETRIEKTRVAPLNSYDTRGFCARLFGSPKVLQYKDQHDNFFSIANNSTDDILPVVTVNEGRRDSCFILKIKRTTTKTGYLKYDYLKIEIKSGAVSFFAYYDDLDRHTTSRISPLIKDLTTADDQDKRRSKKKHS